MLIENKWYRIKIKRLKYILGWENKWKELSMGKSINKIYHCKCTHPGEGQDKEKH